MKKQLLLSGLTALTMLFALTGLARAQYTFTFNPSSGSTVSAGDEIEVTCTPATEGEVVYCWFSSMEEAQATQPGMSWDPYEEEKPTVSAGKTVLAVVVNDGSFAEPDFKNVAYAEYELDGNAAAPTLAFSELTGNQYGMYVPFHAALTLEGKDLESFEVYYSLYGKVPSKSEYDDDDIMLARGTDGSAEIMLTVAAAPYFKAIAYATVDGEEVVSNLVEMNMTAYEVAKPEFIPATPALGNVEVQPNTVLKIKDNTLTGAEDEKGATILYSMDGETLPLESAYYDDENPNVFLYNDEEGITITEDVTILVIAYKTIGGDGFGLAPSGGSELLRTRFTVAKPTVEVSLSTQEWALGTEAPTVGIVTPEGVTLGLEAGKAALKLFRYNSEDPDQSLTQIITDSGTAIDMSAAIAADRVDTWFFVCSLVKGDNTEEDFEGDLRVNPESLMLDIVKDGEKPEAPRFSHPSGEVESGTQVTLTCATDGATIYYTYGTEFITTPYTTPFVITSDCTIRAMAEKDGIESNVVSATYRLKRAALPEPTVTLTPAPGEIEAGTEIEIEVDAEKVSNEKISAIYYRLYPSEDSANNDKDPIANVGFLYPDDGKPVPTVENPVLRVGVFRSQESPYEIRQWDYAVFTYTFKGETAIEAGELAGVNIYPNPAEGEFKVNVPERARIEIFGMNGAKVMSREVNAGVEAFRLNSGIYFVRVTAGNKTAVKRVVVL